MRFWFIILLLFPFATKAQSYIPLLGHESEWHVTTCFTSCLTDVYYTDGDTLYNGQNYTVLNGYHYISRTFWLREDIQEKKVFLSIKPPNKERQEYLLYDFSLEIGDSIKIFNPITPFPTSPGYFEVDSIVNVVLTDGLTYRKFYLSATASTNSLELPVWIEGIGSLSIINAPGGTPSLNTAGKLSCHIHDGQVVYTQLDSIAGCQAVYVADLEDVSFHDLIIFPNPAHNKLIISGLDKNSSVELLDIKGRILSKNTEINSEMIEIVVEDFQSGVYLVNLRHFIGISTTRKIVIE